MEQRLKEIERLANNVLYFNDGADYEAVLWDILKVAKGVAFVDEDLVYIEKEED